MLPGARYSAALPCSDLQRARRFYADKLGLEPADERPDRLFYEGPHGTEFLLFDSSGMPSGSHDQMRVSVADIDAEVRELKKRGVEFEEYDFAGFDKASGIGTVGDHRAAWIRDSEGNHLVIVQLPAGAIDRPGS
jgi:catechol 2,3-dioxygenase-like lactoylglutathione lyase family enzyme